MHCQLLSHNVHFLISLYFFSSMHLFVLFPSATYERCFTVSAFERKSCLCTNEYNASVKFKAEKNLQVLIYFGIYNRLKALCINIYIFL